MMHGLGFRPGETYAELAAWNEIAAGTLIALGLGGPVGPAMLISGMIGRRIQRPLEERLLRAKRAATRCPRSTPPRR